MTDDLDAEVKRRRTFAIISHPDAGKTTLTEKLLLYAGMVRTAGMVGGRKGRKGAASDWMAMERERGISITSSAMQFPYKDTLINVLDTPGHQDFSEDTYRTLTAADCAVMVLDAAKGVEAQTRKLFAVCKLRGIPVMTFVNKMDLAAKDPLDLLSEIEEVLGIATSPLFWPVGSGREFAGVLDLRTRSMLRFERTVGGATRSASQRIGLDELDEATRGEIELVEGAGVPFELEAFLAGEVTPVFFGSALTNFGVEPFFDAFVELAPPPGPRKGRDVAGEPLVVDPVTSPFCAFVFKIQANMNPRHRDRTAFLRICSGSFDRQTPVRHHRLGREVRLSHPHSLLAGDRETLEAAYPGDVIGVINPGLFQIGDTVSATGEFELEPLPAFQPEVFARIRPVEVSQRKAFDKGIQQLADEGTVQVLERVGRNELVYGVVGKLQLDVLVYRLREEYGVEARVELLAPTRSAWIEGDVASFKLPYECWLVEDRKGRPMVLLRNDWDRQRAAQDNPDHTLLDMLRD